MRKNLNRKDIDRIFETSGDQAEACVALYRLAFPHWDEITRIDGFPSVGKEAGEYIWKRFMAFDRQHHPDVFNGGLWLNKGFSTLEGAGLGPWELSTETCKVERAPPPCKSVKETLDEVKAAAIGTKIPVTEKAYWHFLEIVPPAFMFGAVAGELADFGFAEGANEIIAFRKEGEKHYAWRTGVLAHG